MRRLVALWLALSAPLLATSTALAQEQQARTPAEPAPGAAVYDLVAGDRETAWRINRVTGEVVVCRVDTTGSLDAARARCSPALLDTASQQSRTPGGGGRP
jgi:hypothetical protein